MKNYGYPPEYLQGVTFQQLSAALNDCIRDLLKTYTLDMLLSQVIRLKAQMAMYQRIIGRMIDVDHGGFSMTKVMVTEYPWVWVLLLDIDDCSLSQVQSHLDLSNRLQPDLDKENAHVL